MQRRIYWFILSLTIIGFITIFLTNNSIDSLYVLGADSDYSPAKSSKSQSNSPSNDSHSVSLLSNSSDSKSITALGNASCSAIGCHGQSLPKDSLYMKIPEKESWRYSYTHWQAYDPHQQAYLALESELAKHMIHLLNQGEDFVAKADQKNNRNSKGNKNGQTITNKKQPWREATKEERCLVCHANPMIARVDETDPALNMSQLTALRAEGVSCESCHGDASSWRQAHVGWENREGKSEKYREHGMIWLNDLASRSRNCASCHIGAPEMKLAGKTIPARDVTHELIAAGHPRLNFEFASFQSQLSPHWQEINRTDGSKPGPEFSARTWLTGRSTQIETALRLLETHQNNDWPELADFQCYSCHQSIRSETHPPMRKRHSGMWNWQPAPMMEELFTLNQNRFPQLNTALVSYLEVKKSLETTSGRAMVPNATLTKSIQLWESQSNAFAKNQLTSNQLGEFWQKADTLCDQILTWDESAQLLYGIDAWRLSINPQPLPYRPNPNDLWQQMKSVSAKLRFPRNQNSPLFYTVPESTRQELKKILRAVGSKQ